MDVLELQRGGERLLPPLADRRLEAGDRLLLRITRPDLLRLQQDHTVQLTTQGQNAGFSFTLISLPVWLAGAIYLVMAPRVLLPDRGATTNDLGNTSKTSSYCTEVRIPPDSELVGRSR